VHLEALDSLVVLDDRVKRLLLELLPVAAQIVLVVTVEEQQEVLDVGDDLLELEVALGVVELVGLLLQLTQAVWCAAQRLSDALVHLHETELILLVEALPETIVLDHPELAVAHEEAAEHEPEGFDLVCSELADEEDLVAGETLLRAHEKPHELAELFLAAE